MKKIAKIEQERLMLIFGIIIIGFIVYKEYFLLNEVYLYNDVGSDTYYSYWPYLNYLSNMIYSGDFSLWSFNIGIGTSMFSLNPLLTDPFNIFATLWGPKLVVYVLPYITLMKIMIAALGFYAYLKYIGINKYSSLIASLLYGFNGFIILWGQHYHMGTIIVFIPFVLLGFEKWMKEKKIYFYVISLFFIAVSSYYFLYMFTVFFIMYVVVRYFETYRFQMKHFGKFISKIALLSILSIALSCFILFPSVFVVLNNPRLSAQIIGNEIFNFASLMDYISIILRLFSNDILGTGNEFYGLWNYYEAPILYTGTLSLLLVPLYFVYANSKNRIIYGILFFVLFIFLLFPFFSQLLNAFSANSYRWTFIIIVFICIINAKSLNYITEKKIKMNTIQLLFLLLSFAFISVESLMIGNDLLNWSQYYTHSFKHLFISLLLLVLYCILMKRINGSVFKYIILVMICIELAIFSSVTVNRDMVSNESIEEKIGYNDYTNEAVDYINSMDESQFRIDKSYNSVFLADAMVQGYKGVKAYNSLNQYSYVSFLEGMEVPFKVMNHPNYLTGLDSNTAYSRLLGVKYLLINNSAIPPNGYDLINKIEDVSIYEDRYYLPLGFVYDKFISYEEFMELNMDERSSSLLKSFVSNENETDSMKYDQLITGKIEETSIISTMVYNEQDIGLINIEPISGDLKTALNFNALDIDPQIIMPVTAVVEENQAIKVSMTINSSIPSEGQIFFGAENGFSEENSTKFKYGVGETYIEKTLDFSSLGQLRIDTSNAPGQYTISDFQIQIVNNDSFSDVKNLREYTLDISKFSNDHIQGSIKVDKPKKLFMSIPFDKGWSAKINGENVEISEINLGFIGIDLPAGNSKIELNYTPPLLFTGCVISLISLLGIVIYSIRFRKRR